MALVGVAQPGYKPKEESSFDKVLKGLQVAGQLINVGAGLADSFTKSKEADTNAEIAEIKKQEAAANFAKTFEPASIDPSQPPPPDVYKFKKNGQDEYYKLRPDRAKLGELSTGFKEGYFIPLDRNLSEDAIKVGKDVRQGEGGIFYMVNPDAASMFQETHKLQLDKLRSEIDKNKADAMAAGKKKDDDLNKAADDLRKEFEQKPEIRGARDVIAIADRADELVKRNTVSDQVAMAYGFIRSQGPGVVSQQEIDLASRGSFSDEVMNRFGWTRLKDGRFMTEDQMKGVADTLKSTANTLIRSLEPQVATYSSMAKERGLNVDNVIIPLRVRQKQLFQELDPSYLLKKDPREMSTFEKELFQKNYGGGGGR